MMMLNYPRLIHSILPVKYIPKPGMKRHQASTWFPWIIFFKDLKARNDSDLMRHEKIHHYQMLDFVFPAIICAVIGLKWWLVILVLLGQPIIHLINYLILLIAKGELQFAYRNTAFEGEAYSRMHVNDYLKTRIPFAWIVYLIPKKGE